VLRLPDRHPVPGDDDDLLRVGQGDGRVVGIDRPHGAFDGGELLAALGAEAGEEDVGEGAVHGPRHELGEERTGGADDRPGDDQRGVAEHVALKAHGQAGEGVVEGDDDGHVGAADGQRHHEAVGEGGDEEGEQGDLLRAADRAEMLEHDDDAEGGSDRQDEQVDDVLPLEDERPLDEALELGEGDHAAAEGHGADKGSGDAEDGDARRGVVDAEELGGGDGRGRAAAHAVVHRHHLRHVGHLDPPGGDPGDDAADAHGQGHEDVVAHARRGERDGRGDEHAHAGPHDAVARRARRAHPPEAEDEEQRGGDVAQLDDVSAHRRPPSRRRPRPPRRRRERPSRRPCAGRRCS